MVATSVPQSRAIECVVSSPARLAQWRQVCQVKTVEEAEKTVAELKACGVTASVSMVDGLCVIARRKV